MTASSHGGPELRIYVAREAWPTVQPHVHGFHGAEDALGSVVGSATEIDTELIPATVEVERLLDRHWIAHLTNDATSRRQAERSFFSSIADHYESEIDADRNRANFRLLMLRAHATRRCRVLDFGCGPGLSVRAVDEVTLIGCDVSPAMRRQAELRGLTVIPPEGLANLSGTVEAVIASYVLHLAVPAADWLAAVQCVRPGGRVAANFHKGRGLRDIERAMQSAPRFRQLEGESLDDELHGPIRVWEMGR